MFELIQEPLPGLKLLKPRIFSDPRGAFVKTYHEGLYHDLAIDFALREEFFSISSKNVLRGMHFQTPPHAHNKLVYCVAGSVLDVVVDLRKDQPTFGQSASFELSAANRHLLYIPVGFAHGFLANSDDACMVYKTDAVYAPENDTGIRWDSFGFQWPVESPIISDRDQAFEACAAFESPF